MGINFHEPEPYKEFSRMNFAFALRNILLTFTKTDIGHFSHVPPICYIIKLISTISSILSIFHFLNADSCNSENDFIREAFF